MHLFGFFNVFEILEWHLYLFIFKLSRPGKPRYKNMRNSKLFDFFLRLTCFRLSVKDSLKSLISTIANVLGVKTPNIMQVMVAKMCNCKIKKKNKSNNNKTNLSVYKMTCQSLCCLIVKLVQHHGRNYLQNWILFWICQKITNFWYKNQQVGSMPRDYFKNLLFVVNIGKNIELNWNRILERTWELNAKKKNKVGKLYMDLKKSQSATKSSLKWANVFQVNVHYHLSLHKCLPHYYP